ncbi:MAG TPA: hypothetical protein VFE91_05565 [Nitrososphaerales archaeon]|nr:hypothetical protein [Nitrososphaerales archaeon]
MRRSKVMVNPARVVSALLLIASPFLTWITIVSVVLYNGAIIFGTAAQSDLMMVSSQQLGTGISAFAAGASTLAIALLIVSGVVMLKSPKVGVPLGAIGLAAYVIPMYAIFGDTTNGFQQTFISPGIGVFVAATGVVLGSLSFFTKPDTLRALAASLKTQRGLASFGVPLAVAGLVLDVTNHTVLGQLPDFIGQIPIEQFLHLGLVAVVSSLLVLLALGKRVETKYLLGVSIAALALLSADAVYSTYTGNLHDFLGHNLTETALHLSVYYGIALTAIGGLFGRK